MKLPSALASFACALILLSSATARSSGDDETTRGRGDADGDRLERFAGMLKLRRKAKKSGKKGKSMRFGRIRMKRKVTMWKNIRDTLINGGDGGSKSAGSGDPRTSILDVPVARPNPFIDVEFDFIETVTNLDDSGEGSLRNAIENFNNLLSTLEPVNGLILFEVDPGIILLESPLIVQGPTPGSALLLNATSDELPRRTYLDSQITIEAPWTITNAVECLADVSFGIESLSFVGGSLDTIIMQGSSNVQEDPVRVFFTAEDSNVMDGGRRGVFLLNVSEFYLNKIRIKFNLEDGFRFDLDLAVGETAATKYFGTVLGATSGGGAGGDESLPSFFDDNGRDGFHVDEGFGEVYVFLTDMNDNGRDGLYVADQTLPSTATIALLLIDTFMNFNFGRDGANLANAFVEFRECEMIANGANGSEIAAFTEIALVGTRIFDNTEAGIRMLSDPILNPIPPFFTAIFDISASQIGSGVILTEFADNGFGAIVQSGP